ncbi:BTAD domain-containing putative transcriptional regulator [Actinoplanes sp. N902-109]|uniref:BTAD domain-containing putative transcriptional regulator n=1 Tax=Actinoplanes sp. (strain N902-109) TaxID=649831 RepID=UPI0003293793|nr:BTAD domain-containing putative transcriptional regulator [Actinoplanes sp. N902-109]AGL14109.1 SARP family transcriptional regulator [Actinoplanes sp. N902-109]
MPTTPDQAPDRRLRVAVLGPVRAWLGDRELSLGAARQRALFAVLAAAAGRVVGRDELIEGIWGETPPATAAGSVYTYISGLRRVLGHDLLTSGPSGYALQLAPEDLDSERYLRLVQRGGELTEAGDLRGAAAVLTEASMLWHGEAYAGLTGHRLELERTRLTDRRLTAIELRARAGIELGEEDAVANLTARVRDYPLHEPLHELLMLALHRTGRRTEALEVFRAARRTLLTELGVEPGPALTELHQRVLTGAAEPAAGRPVPPVLPAQVARALRDGLDGRALTGRDTELAELRQLARDVAAGRGSAVWIEGEPGIGKTELLTAAFADAAELGCQVAWGVADELDQHVPLQVVTRALGLEAMSDDARVATVAQGLHEGNAEDASLAAVADRVLAYVRAACAIAPLVLVVDDLQWADESSVLFWDRLVAATSRLPLLLVAAARPEPSGHELAQLRRSVQNRQGHAYALPALPEPAIEAIVTRLVGAPIGPHLAAVVPRSGGNPLCAREMVTALLRRGAVRVTDGRADIDAAEPVEAPRSLLAVVQATLDFLSADTQEVLRMAALLGAQFAVDDVVAVTGRSPFDLMANLEEALSANVVVDAGDELAFRHPFLRQALYESIPAPARAALHRHTAEVLERGGSPVTRVAEQLAAETPAVDEWVVAWLARRHAEVVKRAPMVAGGLLRQALGTSVPTAEQRAVLLVALVRLEFRSEQWPMDEAREAAEIAGDPADRAEMRQLLAVMTFRRGDQETAIEMLERSLVDPDVPEIWRTRHRVVLANFRRGDLDDLDRADRTAERLRAEAEAADQPYEAAFALQTSWLTHSIRRDHERALEYVDRALDIMRDHPTFAGMYFDLLDNRMFTLQNLDRLDEAERTLREAALFAIRHRLPSSLQVASAVQYYWLGRWDDALAEVSAVTDDAPGITFLGMREPGAVSMLLHGVAALIAGHRDDADLAAGHLDSADVLPATDAERESCDFLLVARALVAEQQDRPAEALDILAPLLVPEYAPMMLRHQWLPDALRLALAQGRRDIAEHAAALCAAEAGKEIRRARAWAASERCRALLAEDPEPALAAAEHYRAVGRVPELAAALEDAAVLLAVNRRPHEAARTGAEAAELYTVLGARWDLRRTHQRLAEVGIDPTRKAVSAG